MIGNRGQAPISTSFARKLIDWQRAYGRHDLPWQGTRDPYRIWLSEVMLQQTQVATVIPYYERFLKRFPTVQSLARAREEEVLRLWSGLGYYARGRNLHRAARRVAQPGFPRTARAIAELPGVGRSTAAAIAVFAYGERAAILDGNAKRVLARTFTVGEEDELWRLAERLLPKRDVERYTQSLMDLGATICTRMQPRCGECPVKQDCRAHERGSIDRFPAPREKRVLPLREATWWVLLKNGRVLLEKRPGSGLWGGLLTFPEIAHDDWQIAARRQLPSVEHGFTHFRLRATPVLCMVEAAKPTKDQQWLALAQAMRAAVPTPVKKLLIRIRGGRASAAAR
ncbi:MAG TPA: A/G-specific adenine glycosylase [Burkholderiales bacterium]|nr:A/G-specific adenine glycosylase [Burkholderiales bacterium]